jgi:hypothetical protein
VPTILFGDWSVNSTKNVDDVLLGLYDLNRCLEYVLSVFLCRISTFCFSPLNLTTIVGASTGLSLKALSESILDPNFGVLEHLETEISENLDEVRQMYAHWAVPLMIVSIGKFFPYTEADYDSGLMMEDYRLKRMYVRNYDEGDIAG